MNKIKICHSILWICEDPKINTSKFTDEFVCLPSAHVEGSLKGRPEGDAENPIHNTLSKTSLAIYSAYKRPTWVCLQS